MAEFGANYPCFKPDNANSGVVLGKLVSANLTVQLASGELYADDALDEQASEFTSGSIAMQTNDLEDGPAQVLYGCQIVDGELVYSKDDAAPRGCLAYYKVLMRAGQKYFKGYYYPQAQAAIGNDNAQTKGSNITFNPVSTGLTIFADANGVWRRTKMFNSAAAAKAWCDTKCSVAQHYKINVVASGLGSGKAVDKLGEFYVASGDDFVINVTGNPTSVYDNGATKTVQGNKVTLSTVNTDHTVMFIF